MKKTYLKTEDFRLLVDRPQADYWRDFLLAMTLQPVEVSEDDLAFHEREDHEWI